MNTNITDRNMQQKKYSELHPYYNITEFNVQYLLCSEGIKKLIYVILHLLINIGTSITGLYLELLFWYSIAV
jgi:hypothetical protein